MGLRPDGNAYYRVATNRPAYLVTWPVGARDPRVYATVAAFRAGAGQEQNGTEFSGTPIVDATYHPTAALLAVQGTVARPLPASIAALLGAPAGERRLGARFD
jgi:hypothetical protein